MPRSFHIPGVLFLFSAFVLLFLASVSLPYLTALDFARVHFEGITSSDQGTITELRVSVAPFIQLYGAMWEDKADGFSLLCMFVFSHCYHPHRRSYPVFPSIGTAILLYLGAI